MAIDSINDRRFISIEGLDRPVLPDGPKATDNSRGVNAFAQDLKHAIDETDATQNAADEQAIHTALGGGNLHEVAIALEQADISLKMAVKVRNKVVDAYQEIMRMQV